MLTEKINKVFSKSPKNKIRTPSIEITLTTFTDDDNGDISEATPGVVKIDGEEDAVKKEASSYGAIFESSNVRNLLVLSASQFLLFVAFDSLANIQSTINSAEGIGTISLATIYGLFIFSSFFLPCTIIKYLDSKKTLLLGMTCFCPFIIANFYPSWVTLIPTAVLCGIASGPLWIARCTYLNLMSHSYAKLQKIPPGIVNAWFFSVCTTFHQNVEIWGNLLSYYILKTQYQHEPFLSKTDLDSCGSHVCTKDVLEINTTSYVPDLNQRYVLVTILAALSVMGVIFLALFLDPVESKSGNDAEDAKLSSRNILDTFHQLVKPDQLLLLPLSIYTGLINGFYSGDYTRTYLACVWGTPHVASVSICYGVVSSLVAATSGPCVIMLGRMGLFLLATTAHIVMLVALTLWTPHPEHTSGFYLIAIAHGIGNGIWMSQLVALYGVVFKDRNEVAAFSCHYFLYSLGFSLSFTLFSYICSNFKLYIPLTVLIISIFLLPRCGNKDRSKVIEYVWECEKWKIMKILLQTVPDLVGGSWISYWMVKIILVLLEKSTCKRK